MDILKSYFIGNYYTHSYVPCFQNFTVLINGDLKNKQDLDFPCYMSLSSMLYVIVFHVICHCLPCYMSLSSMLYVIVFICGLRFEVRGDCSFC